MTSDAITTEDEELMAAAGTIEPEVVEVEAEPIEMEGDAVEAEPIGMDADAGEVIEEEPGLQPAEEEWTPEWLSEDAPDQPADDQLDWLDTLGEVDAESWLESEGETSADDIVLVDSEIDLQPVADIEYVPDQEDIEEPELMPVNEVPFTSLEVPVEIDQDRLNLAGTAAAAGNFGQAVEGYSVLLDEGSGLPFLIADLEDKVEQYREEILLKRVLGDAYVRNGQLHKALDVYRQALDQL